MNARRYTLTVPTHDNDGHSLDAVRRVVEACLTADFRGFTCTGGRGYWGGEHAGQEGVVIYTVDVSTGGADFGDPASVLSLPTDLRALAEYVAREARQEAVYLTRQPIETWLITAPAECDACGGTRVHRGELCPQCT